jgi:hypothetical protein
MSWYEWRPYVPVAERRRQAQSKLKKLKKKGESIAPVTIEGRTIAKSFWGKSWCDNLERYSDYENRLPRGRTYVRNGSVVDLQIGKGEVVARVAGSAALDIHLPGLRGDDRFPGRAIAGTPGQRRHGPGLPGGRRPVSVP